MAMMLAQASIVPECYRGEGQIGDWVIALEIANRIRGLGAGGDAELENGSGQTWLVSAISHLVRQRDKTLLAYPLSNDRNARGR